MTVTSPTDLIVVDVRDRVATVRLNRAHKLNAVTQAMSDDLIGIIADINDDPTIRAVVYTGTGRAFCAGSDISTLDQYATPWEFRNRRDYCDALRECRKPIIAAVNGYAFGGGLEAALTCDIRLAAQTATFAAPEVKLGWVGGGGMVPMLARSIGMSTAAMMVMTGDPIDAPQALARGLISESLPAEKLLERAQELAATIASRPPIAVETAKANLRAAQNLPLEAAIAYERDLQAVSFATDDAAEGRAAFAQKRPGTFHGR